MPHAYYAYGPLNTSVIVNVLIVRVSFSLGLKQEVYLEQLMAGPFFSAEERDVVRWGTNAKITIPKRFSQSGKHAQTYRAATAIECLVSHH